MWLGEVARIFFSDDGCVGSWRSSGCRGWTPRTPRGGAGRAATPGRSVDGVGSAPIDEERLDVRLAARGSRDLARLEAAQDLRRRRRRRLEPDHRLEVARVLLLARARDAELRR